RPQTFTPSEAGIFEQRYDRSGTALGPVTTISTSGRFLDSPSIAGDRRGNFVATWQGYVSDPDRSIGVRGERLDGSGRPIGLDFAVDTYATGTQSSPSVAIDATGDFEVVWDSDGQDGSSNGVFGARFDRRGNRISAEFPVNTYTSGAQARPRIADDGRGL